MRPRVLAKSFLNDLQKEVLIGLLLSDGCLERWRSSKTARLKVEQSLKQAMFVNWLFEVFADLVKTPPREKRNKSLYFNTLTLGHLYPFYETFYPKRKKVVPDSIEGLLTPLAFSVWFMGDGSVKSKECNGRILNTHGFTKPEIERLCEILNRKYGLKSSIRRQKDGLQIYISAKSAGALTKLVAPHLLPCFSYKLPKNSGS